MAAISGKIKSIGIKIPDHFLKNISTYILKILTALAGFSVGLLIPWPQAVASMLQEDIVFLMLAAFPYLYFLLTRTDKKFEFVFIAAFFFWFAFPLRALWQGNVFQQNSIGGLLPRADASFYLRSANYMLTERKLMDNIAFVNRTLFVFPFTMLFALLRQNLRLTLTVITFFSAGSVFLLTRQSQKSMSAVPAAAIALLLWVYHTRLNGMVMSEVVAFTVGCLAAAFLLWAARDRYLPAAWAGLGLLSLALNIRPGPFFILPVLLVWGFIFFRDANGSGKRFLLGAVIVMGFVFGINYAYAHLFTMQPIPSYGQLPHLLWGLATGEDVNASLDIFPELLAMPYAQRTRLMYYYFFQAFFANPLRFFQSSAVELQRFLFFRACSIFALIAREFWVTAPLSFISLGGMIAGWTKKSDPTLRMLGTGFVGVLLTVPIINYVCDRPYAAVVALIVLLPVYTVWCLARLALRLPVSTENNINKSNPNHALTAAGLFAAALVLVSPFAAYGLGRAQPLPPAACPDGTDLVVIQVRPGNVLHITEETSDPFADQIALVGFRYTHHWLLMRWGFTRAVDQIIPGESITYEFDYLSKEGVYVIAETEFAESLKGAGVVPICGWFSSEPDSFNMFYAGALAETN